MLLVSLLLLCLSCIVSVYSLALANEHSGNMCTPELNEDGTLSSEHCGQQDAVAGHDKRELERLLAYHGGSVANPLAYNDCEFNHLECDVHTMGLSESQLERTMDAYNSENVQSLETLSLAEETGFKITPHTAFRYYASSEWKETYHGTFVNDSIVETAKWRKEFGIHDMDTIPLVPLIEAGLSYVDTAVDVKNRPIMYIKTENISTEASQVDYYLQLIMYTVEKAERVTNAQGNGEFICVVDMDGYTWNKSPPFSILREMIGYLKKHYPYRLGAVYIVNTSMAFSMLWKMFRPLLPKRAIDKTFVLSKGEAKAFLRQKIGEEGLEESYGGKRGNEAVLQDFDAYMKL